MAKCVFKLIFSDVTLSKDKLVRISSKSWYDGRVVLFEGTRRTRATHHDDWYPDHYDRPRNEDDKNVVRASFMTNGAGAVRGAVAAHDALVAEWLVLPPESS